MDPRPDLHKEQPAQPFDTSHILREVLSPPERSDEIGRLGSYRVLEILGRGGMGMVFRAEDTTLKRQIALKIMLPHLAAESSARARFRREAEAQAQVQHENVAAIHQVGEANGVPFIAMPLLRGVALSTAMNSNPPLPLCEVIRIAREIAEGLGAAHVAGLVHRDIKPNNIWLEGPKRRVLILDFGLARAEPGTSSDVVAPITTDGGTVGTPAYMSPEQVEGRAVDNRADLFALGIVLYQMVTGQLPFNERTTFATLLAVTRHKQPAPDTVVPGVPQSLSNFIQLLLAKKREERPQTAQAALTQLESIESELRGTPLWLLPLPLHLGKPTTPWADTDTTKADTSESELRAQKPAISRSRRWRLVLGAAIGLLVVTGTGFFAAHLLKTPEPKGVLIVEADEPNWEIVIKQNGEVVRDRTRDRSFALPPGNYAIEPAGPIAGLKASPDRIALAKDATERVKLRIDKADPPAPKDTSPTPKDPTPVTQNPALATKDPPSTSAPATDRKAAEALGSHAGLTLKLTSGKDINLKRGDPLPAEEFTIAEISFETGSPQPPVVNEVVFPAIAQLRQLTSLKGWNTLVLNEDRFNQLSQFPAAATLVHLSAVLELTPGTLDALKRFPKLVSLGAHASSVDDDLLERFVQEHPNISQLLLENVGKSQKVTKRGLAALGKLPLQIMELSACPVVDAAFIRLLADKPYFWLVSFRGSSIDDGALEELQRCFGVAMLVLENTKVTSAGVDYLQKMTQLRSLLLKGTKVTEADVKKLEAALPNCKIEWNGGVIDPKSLPVVERRAAVILGQHADLELKLPSGKDVTIKKGAALPTEPFVVISIAFSQVKLPPKFADEVLLPTVATLSSLQSIGAVGSGILALTEEQVVRLSMWTCAKTLTWLVADFEFTHRVLDALKSMPALSTLGCFVANADDALLERLAELPKLGRLILAELGKSGKVTERGFKAITKLPDVTNLGLAQSPSVGKALFRALASMSALRGLAVNSCSITDDDLRELAGCSQITTLVLTDIDMTDKITSVGVEYLQKMPQLRNLILMGTKVTEADVNKLSAALPNCKITWNEGVIEAKSLPEVERRAAMMLGQHADLGLKLPSGKDVTIKKGAALPTEPFVVISIAFSQVKPPSKFTEEVLLPTVATLSSLQLIGAFGSGILALSEEQVVRLSMWPCAKTLSWLVADFELTPRVLDALKSMPALSTLACFVTNADDALLERIAEIPKLQRLNLTQLGKSGKVTERGSKAIAKHPAVTDLGFAQSPSVGKALFRALASMSALRGLALSSCPTTDDDLRELAGCSQITTLVLTDMGVTDASLEQLTMMKGLLTLRLGNTKVTKAGLEKLGQALPKCRIVWEGGVIEPKAQPEVERSAALTLGKHADLVVKLSSGKDVLVRKGEALPAETFVVTFIAFAQVRLPPKFAEEVLLPTVATLSSLTTISVFGIGILAPTEEQLVRLSMLPCAKTLAWLGADFELTPRVLDALKSFPALTTLGCFVTSADDALLERLAEIPKLKVLYVTQLGKTGKVSERGFKAISKLPVSDLGLTLCPSAGKAMFREMASMSALRTLNITSCPTTDDDLRELAGCSQITSLVLNDVGMTDAGLEQLAMMKGLLALRLTKTKVTKPGIDKLAQTLPKCQITWEGSVIEPKKQ